MKLRFLLFIFLLLIPLGIMAQNKQRTITIKKKHLNKGCINQSTFRHKSHL